MTLFFAALVLVGLIAAGLAAFTAMTARRVAAALPPNGRFLDVDGARIHYVDQGSGPAIVLIHGLAGQLRHFTHSLVARLSGEFRVIAIDRPGSGHSTRAPGASARVGAQAEAVAQVIRALGLERPVLVGHSLGGAVALGLALEHPELVGGLALIAPLTHVQEAPPAMFTRLAIRSPLVRRLVAWTVATPSSIARSRAVLEVVFAPDAVPHDFATAAGGLLGLRPTSFYAASTDLVAVNDDLRTMVERYGSLRIPVGVLYGTGDRLLDYRVHGEPMAAKVPKLKLELTEGGHMLPITAPDLAARFVRDVVRSVHPSPSEAPTRSSAGPRS